MSEIGKVLLARNVDLGVLVPYIKILKIQTGQQEPNRSFAWHFITKTHWLLEPNLEPNGAKIIVLLMFS